MKLKTCKHKLIAISVGLMAVSAQAETYSFDFGTMLTGGYQPTQTFAHMSVSTVDHFTYTFKLHAFANLDTAFGTAAGETFIGKAEFNTDLGEAPITGSTALTASSWGVTRIQASSGSNSGGGSIRWDFGDTLGRGDGDRLTAGETVEWTMSFIDIQSDPFFDKPAMFLHVQGFEVGEGSGKYIPTSPIPEPETYAMLLAGLGLMGFVARRRKNGMAG